MFLDIFKHLLTMFAWDNKKIQEDDPVRSPADDVIALDRFYFNSGKRIPGGQIGVFIKNHDSGKW
jgi:hypothetical protein